jgi:hypothetical protein
MLAAQALGYSPRLHPQFLPALRLGDWSAGNARRSQRRLAG